MVAPRVILPGLSLSNKCQLLFGVAVAFILFGALAVPWVRDHAMITDSQIEVARQLADAWLDDHIQLGTLQEWGLKRPGGLEDFFARDDDRRSNVLRIFIIDVEDVAQLRDPFVQRALLAFRADPETRELSALVDVDGQTVYRYARALREEEMQAIRDRSVVSLAPGALDTAFLNPLRRILVIDRRSAFAESQILVSQVYIIAAGVVGLLLAVLVFYFILTKLILSPVRKLRRTTDLVQAGDLSVRSQIRTGDEFESLAAAFNAMLDKVGETQYQLRAMNESLDLKLGELAEANVGLYEANRLKSEFLANVSHELKTPLNSIIGFAELLDELAGSEADADPKRRRYLRNILTSGRRLLEMISELLDMAKIEAGRMEVNIEPTSIVDLIEGLVGIMRPQADIAEATIEVKVARNLPVIETDPGKLQQILYNFLSNAVKFSPRGGVITITADRFARQHEAPGVRVGVSDQGPGVPDDMQDTIFEKFRQADASHTREHAGTGLGLAICRELAEMLGATVALVSEPGQGATFYVELPVRHEAEEPQSLMG